MSLEQDYELSYELEDEEPTEGLDVLFDEAQWESASENFHAKQTKAITETKEVISDMRWRVFKYKRWELEHQLEMVGFRSSNQLETAIFLHKLNAKYAFSDLRRRLNWAKCTGVFKASDADGGV